MNTRTPLTVPIHTPSLKALVGFLLFLPTLSVQAEEIQRLVADPVSATEVVLTPEQLAVEADRALSIRNLTRAADLYKQLSGTDPDHATYGMASIQTLRGDFVTALTTLGDMHLRRQSPYNADAAALRGRLLLTLADAAQQTGKLDDAEARLKEFHQAHRDSRDMDRFEALMRKQTRLRNLAENRPPIFTEPPLRVGVLLPLSGPYKAVGEDMLHSILLAVFENKANNLTVMPLDTGSTPEGAQIALNHALSYGVDVIVGPLLSSSVAEIKPYARAAGKPVIAFSSDATVAGGDVYLMSFVPAEQARRMARHGIEQGKTSFAALLPDNAYGNEMLQAFAAEVSKLGGKLVRHAFYDPKEVDLSSPLRSLVQLDKAEMFHQKELAALERQYRELGRAMDDMALSRLKHLRKTDAKPIIDFEALFVPAPAESMPLIAPQLAFYDVDSANVLLLGSTLWDSPKILKNHGEYLRGGHFPAPDKTSLSTYEQAFKDTFNQKPHPLAVLGYDTIHLLAELMMDGRIQSATLGQRLEQESGFHGAAGAYRFTDGGITQRQFDIVDIRTRGFKTLEQAPVVWPPRVPERQSGAPVWRSLFDPFF
ncbi:MAG: ABC transporter substrate-binding protein [Proteobacteria bacterium]|nr:ABC transporter substrate-binding protein [Pseudomonadota bacterium]